MKSQKGSVTVIALIMLLFLVILGGAWAIMMTQSKTNALADEKQQQAWYAAEAGFKRVQTLITKGNATWTNLTTDYADIKTNKKENFTTIDLASGIKENNIADTIPWYAASIVTKDSTTNLTGAPSTGTTYTITSVGEYMGERKVITRDVKVASSSGGTTPTTPSDASKAAGDNITIAGDQNLEVSGSLNIKQGSVKSVSYTAGYNANGTVTYYDANGNVIKTSDWLKPTITSYADFYSKLFDGLYTYDWNTKTQGLLYQGNYSGQAVTSMSSNKTYDLTTNLIGDQNLSSLDNVSLNVSGNRTVLLYLGNNARYTITNASANINVDSGSLLIIIAPQGFEWSGFSNGTKANISGDVVILSYNTTKITNMISAAGSRIYIVANGDLSVTNSIITNGFIAGNQVNIKDTTLAGQIVGRNRVSFTTSGNGYANNITGDNSVLSYYGYPSDIVAKITKP